MSFKIDLVYFIYIILLFNCAYKYMVECSTEEERLLKKLFKGYNKLIRPVRNATDAIEITMDLVLLQLINVVNILNNKINMHEINLLIYLINFF